MKKLRTYTITHHHLALATLGLAIVSLVLAVTMATRLHADSYIVTATVPAPLPASPASITSPVDQEHVSTSPITVSGTCPDASYVSIYRDGEFSGMSPCSGNTFSLQLSLVPGANQLQVKVYNLTNNEGPSSPPITVFYDVVSPPTPSVPDIGNFGVDFTERTAFRRGLVFRTSAQPTLSGRAPVDSDVVVVFENSPFECKTMSDANGHWSCTLGNVLPDGTYLVKISATTPEKVKLTFPPFYIVVSKAVPSLLTPIQGAPLTVTCLCGYQAHRPGEEWKWDIIIGGGTPPYTVAIDWDDGTYSKISSHQTQPSMTHTFRQAGEYQPLIKTTDASGNIAILQLYAPVVGESVDIDRAPIHHAIPLWIIIVVIPPLVGLILIMALGLRKLLASLLSKFI